MKKAVHRDMYNLNSENCTGNDIKNSKNCHFVFNILKCEDCKYLYDVLDAKDCYDLNYSLYKPEMSYELISTLAMRYCAFSMASHYCNNVYYCDQCNNSSNLFGCIGLNHKKYCILNKQYSKEEYEKVLPKIIAYLKKTNEWGQFFLPHLSPFGYNQTVASEYFSLSKDESQQKGYNWYESDNKQFQPQTYKIPENIKDIPDSITKEILTCESCRKNYKIIAQELKFYHEQKISVPHKCPDCRHFDRLKLRNPRHLWKRSCHHCHKEIQTSCSLYRKETVYCEQCYIKSVY